MSLKQAIAAVVLVPLVLLVAFSLMVPAADAGTVTLPAAQDAWIDASKATQNKGVDTKLHVRASGPVRRSLLQFDVSSIPACAPITAADLQLVISNKGSISRSYGVHRVLQPWTEGTSFSGSGVTWTLRASNNVYWSTPGGSVSEVPTRSTATVLYSNAVLHWDVAADVASWVSLAAPNYGWLLKDEAELSGSTEFQFYSSENTTTAYRPRLVVTYGDCQAPTASISIKAPVTVGTTGYTGSRTVTVNLSASDPGGVSGYYLSESNVTPTATSAYWVALPSATSYNATVSYTIQSKGDGLKALWVWFIDAQGNVSQPATASIVLDETAPTTTSNALAGWVNADQTVSLTATDGGAGVASTKYCTDTINSCTPGFTGTSVAVSCAAGTVCKTYVRYSSTDLVGHTEATQFALVSIDKTAPTTSALNATSGSTQVTLSWATSSDSGSGLSAAPYTLVYSVGTTAPTSCQTGTVLVNGTGTSYTQGGLTNGTTYSYRLCTTDSVGNFSTSTASATPRAAVNQPPVANAGQYPSTPTGTSVPFSGSGSSDPDGSIVSYAWTFGDGKTGSGVSAPHAYTTAGTYTVTLTVTDNLGATGSATTTVSITNRPPVANAGQYSSTPTGTSVPFSGSGSSDPDGSIGSYAWTFGDGTTGSGVSAPHAYTTAGTYTVTLTVTDNLGATGSATTTVSITNRPPVANAGQYPSTPTGTSVPFSGSGSSDPDGSIVSYAWTFGDGKTGSGVSAPHAYTTAGTYTVTLTVTDNLGATGNATTTVTVSATNQPPVANVSPSNQATQTLLQVTFDGSGSSDPDGTIASYAWTFGDGGVASVAKPSHTYTKAGTFTVTLTVTDNSGAQGSATATVSVANRPPVANAGPDQTATVGTSVTLNGSGSSDPDGTITSYKWTFGDGVTLDSGNVAIVSHTYTNTGPYTVTLTVTDNSGATSSDTAAITVNPSGGGNFLRARRMGGSSGDGGFGVAVDRAGNRIVVGSFVGTADFGGVSLSSSGGSADAFIAKYSSTGQFLWARAIGGTADDRADAVAVDGNGDIFITGYFNGTVDFGGGAITAGITSGGNAFVAKYSGVDGSYRWARGLGPSVDIGYGIAVDQYGDVVLTGGFSGTVDFGNGVYVRPANANSDIFLAKYSGLSGAYQWAKYYLGYGVDAGRAITMDPSGNIVVVGSFQQTIMDPTLASVLTSVGSSTDAFIMKFSPAGVLLLAKDIGGSSEDMGYTVAVDGSSNIVVSGYFQGTVDFGGGPLTSAGSFDIFLAKYTPNGQYMWAKQFGSTAADIGYSLAVDRSNGDIVMAGTFQTALGTAVDFGGGPMTSSGSWDIFVAKFSASGTHVWSKKFGSTSADVAYAVAVDGNRNTVVTGYFQNAVNFGGGSLQSAGATDAFLLELGP